MKRINIGLLGGGFMGRTHTYAYKNLPLYYDSLPFEAVLKIICTSRVESAQKAKAVFGFENATTDSRDIFLDPSIDVVDISTPNVCHKDALLAALQAGKHIYCEKPVVISRKEIEEVELALKKAKHAVRMTVFNYRFVPAVMRAKQLVEEGKLGRLLTFRSAYLHNSSTNPFKPIGWKQNSDFGGVLFDLGSHAADLVQFISGEKIVSVCGKSQIGFPFRQGMDGNEWETNADEAFYMLAKTETGACGTVEANKLALGTNDSLSIALRGTQGALKFSLMDPNYLYFYDNLQPGELLGGNRGYTRIDCVGKMPFPGGIFPSAKAPFGWERTHLHSVYSLLRAVFEGEEACPTLQEGLDICRLLLSAYESDEKGVWVNVYSSL